MSCADAEIGIPHNINKYAENMDIVVSVPQSKMLNKLWTLNIFTNAEKLPSLNYITIPLDTIILWLILSECTPRTVPFVILTAPLKNMSKPLYIFSSTVIQ